MALGHLWRRDTPLWAGPTMSADFWAGYISGAIGIIIGNPLDVLKVRLQAAASTQGLLRNRNSSIAAATTTTSQTSLLSASSLSQSPSPPYPTQPTPTPPSAAAATTAATRARLYLRPWITGTAAPVLGYGALNALLFVSYNRTEAALNRWLTQADALPTAANTTTGTNLWTTWVAGAVGGLATWVVSTPTELIKCRAQLAAPSSSTASSSSSSSSSLAITKRILRTEGVRGLYFGGVVTALRDGVGYGFYFWSYELTSRWLLSSTAAAGTGNTNTGGGSGGSDAARVLMCGGLAGIVTWASIFPLDVIKTRMQTQGVLASLSPLEPLPSPWPSHPRGSSEQQRSPLPPSGPSDTSPSSKGRLGAWEVARETYRAGGLRPFFRGLGVCSVRAFIVNAVQWTVYEWIMLEMGHGRRRGGAVVLEPERLLTS
ncbi:mitochondrial carrier domain-containing protein [Lasiosphaeria miniovina]|uniref:Mitochondrial carrier domain-containing protein n=1 Tax=Lasiosphaeria miniovina TaxID=1954250 RepID=A0AA40DW11_9PEZI|nr:mitochondrial carrier domain-containing protein [Lasiosphaeria miniovina]KAK0713778.1 mitochondrial carrier domain-containing protein [Lasiosphaeria miniovina]